MFSGQLKQLVGWDPVSARIAVQRAPRVVNWVERLDDLSWLPVDGEAGWISRDEIASTTTGLLREVGRTYVPSCSRTGRRRCRAIEIVCEIDGQEYSQSSRT